MKPQNITDDGIRQGIYSPTADITLSDMTNFLIFSSSKFQRQVR